MNDFRRWSQRVGYPEGPKVGLVGPFVQRKRSASPFSLGFAHPDPLWIPFKEVAVTLTYQLAEGPEVICAQMLQGCAKQALEKLENPTEADPSKWTEASLLRDWVGSQPALKGQEPQPAGSHFVQVDIGPLCHISPFSVSKE